MTIPITQPEFGVEIEAEEKKIPANENELTLDGGCQNFRSGIDPTVLAAFAGAALPVKMPSEGSEKSIEVSSCCGCPNPCKCNPCHCEGFAINPNTVTLGASSAPPVLMMPSEGSEKSIKAERKGILPKLII